MTEGTDVSASGAAWQRVAITRLVLTKPNAANPASYRSRRPSELLCSTGGAARLLDIEVLRCDPTEATVRKNLFQLEEETYGSGKLLSGSFDSR
jgi:hypothetical protein